MESGNNIGSNILEILHTKRKKQSWLAEQCGVTKSHINQIVKGKTKPSISLLILISDVLDTSINEILTQQNSRD